MKEIQEVCDAPKGIAIDGLPVPSPSPPEFRSKCAAHVEWLRHVTTDPEAHGGTESAESMREVGADVAESLGSASKPAVEGRASGR